MIPNHDAEQEAAAWADTVRTALMMTRACRDEDADTYWILYEGVPADRGPLLVKLLAIFAAVGRDDRWFQVRLARIAEAEASGELLARSLRLDPGNRVTGLLPAAAGQASSAGAGSG